MDENEDEEDLFCRKSNASRLLQGRSVLQCLSAVAENQPANKNRMTTELSNFAALLREFILSEGRVSRGLDSELRTPNSQLQSRDGGLCNSPLRDFNRLALELFALQFKHNAAYRKICEARRLTPKVVEHWTQIPAMPTSAFKELDLTSLAPAERITVFHSSGTTEQKASRHFHSPESLKLYEASLLPWFRDNVLPDLRYTIYDLRLVCLTPPPAQAPHSSLVHMFETVRQRLSGVETSFVGKLAADGSWTLNFDATFAALNSSLVTRHPSLLLGTAFSFVHLLDYLAERNLRFDLPAGSRVMETGGYKNRSRTMPKAELHQLITERLGVPPSHIICEYGMSELSSQAYDLGALASRRRVFPGATKELAGETPALPGTVTRHFRFPPWARVQIISPETGHEVADGETGLIRVFDLANVFSVMAIQTEDLGIRRGDGFELIGRAQLAESRGCSLMTA
jgi:hypothetical protein